MNQISTPTPDQVKVARIATGLTQRECAERFGYSLTGWQKKEDAGTSGRALSVGEWELLLLLAGQHPTFTLQRNTK